VVVKTETIYASRLLRELCQAINKMAAWTRVFGRMFCWYSGFRRLFLWQKSKRKLL